MHLQLIDIWCNVGTLNMTSQCNLLHGEQRRGKSSNASLFQLLTCLEAFPSRGNLDADPLGVIIWRQMLEMGDNSYQNELG